MKKLAKVLFISVAVAVFGVIFGGEGTILEGIGLTQDVYAVDADGDGVDDETGEPVEAETADPGRNYLSDCGEGQVKTAILGGESGCYEVGNNGEAIFALLGRILTLLTYGVGTLAVLGIVIAGVQYTMSSGDVSKMMKAKQRIIEVVIGLVCWGLLYAFLEWIIPGGIL